MIARLHNIQRIYDEVIAQKYDCVKISSADSNRTSLGSRTQVAPSDVNEFIRQACSDFNGELQVEVWKHGSKDERCKYVLVAGGGGGGSAAPVNGAANMGALQPYIGLMQANFDTRLELEKMKIAQAHGPAEVNYLPQALAAFQSLIGRNKPAPVALPPARAAAPVAGADQDEAGDDDDEPDVFDEFAAADPDAYDVVEHFLQLKVKDPAAYELAKAGLKAKVQ